MADRVRSTDGLRWRVSCSLEWRRTKVGQYVSNAVLCVACRVAAGICRLSHCWWVDPLPVNNCGDLFSRAPLQRSPSGLRSRDQCSDARQSSSQPAPAGQSFVLRDRIHGCCTWWIYGLFVEPARALVLGVDETNVPLARVGTMRSSDRRPGCRSITSSEGV